MSETQNPFVAGYSENAEFERCGDGLYQAVIAGILTRNLPDYNDKSKLVSKIQFITQIASEGTTYYHKTKPFTPIVAEKSNLMVWLNSATGATMEKLREKYPNGFPLENLVGVPVQVVVQTVTGKDGKEYSELANVLKAKKGQKTAVVPDAIPAYLVRGAVNFHLGEGLTVKEDTQKTAQPSKQPFGGAKQGDDPTIPANAKITQGNPAQYVPPAAPPIQAQAAPEVDEDGDELPF